MRSDRDQPVTTRMKMAHCPSPCGKTWCPRLSRPADGLLNEAAGNIIS
jgi:hypothetical protein